MMRTRDTLSNVALTLLGATVLTAGALLYQLARRPSQGAASWAPSAEGTHDGLGAPSRPGGGRMGDVAFEKDQSLLRRLREGGL